MDMRSLASDRWTLPVAAAVTATAVAFLRIDDVATFLAFTALIAASELFEVSATQDVRYSLGLAPALGLALLGSINPGPPSHESLAAVLVAFAIGMTMAIALRALMRRPLGMTSAAGRLLALGAAAGAYHLLVRVDGLPIFDVSKTPGSTDISYVGFAVMFLTLLITQSFVSSTTTAARERVPVRPLFRGTIEGTFALQFAVISVGALLAVAYPALSMWAFPLFLAPLAATQFAFRQFASIQRTYLQTIRALSKVPEMAGYTHPGHSRRVAELSVAIARELGVSDTDVNEIEYAALLHDIGRVSIPDPREAGAGSSMELAVVGATIVRETGHFPTVAEMIEQQHHPYRRRGEGPNATLRVGAKIIKVASEYDDLTRPGGIGQSPSDALDRLSLGMAFDYDPDVVQALRRVLEKQGAL